MLAKAAVVVRKIPRKITSQPRPWQVDASHLLWREATIMGMLNVSVALLMAKHFIAHLREMMQNSQQDMQVLQQLKEVIDALYARFGYTPEVETLQQVFEGVKTRIMQAYADAFEDARKQFPDLENNPEIMSSLTTIRQMVDDQKGRSAAPGA